MAASTPSTIILKNQELIGYLEATAGGTITPGHLVMYGSAGTVTVHNAAGGSSPGGMFAVEDDAQGMGIDDDYTTAVGHKNVRIAVCGRGVEVNAILAASQTIVIGDALQSNGDGTLAKYTAQSNVPAQTSPLTGIRTGQVVARAVAAVTTTGSTARIHVRVV